MQKKFEILMKKVLSLSIIALILFASCSRDSKIIVGTWECVEVERIETNPNESFGVSVGKEMAKSLIVSDSLILKSDFTYIKLNSAIGVRNRTWGKYSFSPFSKEIKMIKNENAPGTERVSVYEVLDLNNDILVLLDSEGFMYTYSKRMNNK